MFSHCSFSRCGPCGKVYSSHDAWKSWGWGMGISGWGLSVPRKNRERRKDASTQLLPSSTWKKAFALRFLIYSSYKLYILRWENKVQRGQMTCLSCILFWCLGIRTHPSLSTQFKHPSPDLFVVLTYTSIIRWADCLGSNPRLTASKVCLSELLKFCSLTTWLWKRCDINNSYLTECLWGLAELIYVKHLGQCLASSKHSINDGDDDDMMKGLIMLKYLRTGILSCSRVQDLVSLVTYFASPWNSSSPEKTLNKYLLNYWTNELINLSLPLQPPGLRRYSINVSWLIKSMHKWPASWVP